MMYKIASLLGVSIVAVFTQGCSNYDGNQENITALYQKYADKLSKSAEKQHDENVCNNFKKECDEKVSKLIEEDREKDESGTFKEKPLTKEQRNEIEQAARDALNSYDEAYDQCTKTAT